MHTRIAALALSLSLTLIASGPAHAQGAAAEFAGKQVTLVVPYPAGGSVDFTARLLAQNLAQQWKNTVIVENRAGAAAVIGTQHVARSKPDGRTILLATAGMSIQPAVYKDLPYDVFKDFMPVTQIVVSPSLLSVHPSIPGTTLPEVIRYLKANPRTPFGSQGLGSHAHLLMEILRAEAGLELLHVPYRGSAPATTALLSGETKLHFDIMLSMLPHVASGKARAIAVTTPERQKQLPNVQTMREAGYPAVEVSSWSGFFVPAGTPSALVNEIQRATRAVIADPAVSARLVEAGYGLVGSTPDEFRAFFRQDVERFQKAAANAKIDKTNPNQ
ncbi:MAG: tripartite tricarboxylate transporter substrate binding protein [Burkholderiaceae bacterium]|nr:tripartite tricarboxylate transporter substrate binding protein [Burkholderiaceae bacterium]